MRLPTPLRLLPLVLLLAAPPLAAADDVPKKRWGEIGVIEKKHPNVAFSDAERKLIRDHYARPGQRPKAPPRALRRRAELPEGWQKHMDKGNVIPDAIWSRRQPLPIAVGRKLKKQPAGVVTVYIEGKVVRVVETTRTILDVISL